MKRIAFLAVIALISCGKEDNAPTREIYLDISCKMCEVHFTDINSGSHAYTIVGRIDNIDVNADGILPDTSITTERRVITVKQGNTVFIEACHLRAVSADGSISIRTWTGIEPLTDQADQPDSCARIDQMPAFL